MPASARVLACGLLGAAYLAGFAIVTVTAVPEQSAALTVTDALIDRFGQLTLIVLSETTTGVVGGLAAQQISGLTLSVGMVAVGFGAWWTYFGFAGNRRLRPERTAAQQWMFGHLPLTAAVAAMGTAMVSLVDHAHEGRTPVATGWVLCAGAAVALVCLGVGAARSAPIVLGVVLVLLPGVPWGLAVAYHLANADE